MGYVSLCHVPRDCSDKLPTHPHAIPVLNLVLGVIVPLAPRLTFLTRRDCLTCALLSPAKPRQDCESCSLGVCTQQCIQGFTGVTDMEATSTKARTLSSVVYRFMNYEGRLRPERQEPLSSASMPDEKNCSISLYLNSTITYFLCLRHLVNYHRSSYPKLSIRRRLVLVTTKYERSTG